MTVTTGMPVPPELGTAACARPEHLPLVDAAHEKPGGPEAQEMKRTLCRHCPVAEACGEWAMTHAETGIWAGMSPSVRSRNGAPRGLPAVDRSLHHAHTADGIPAETWRRKAAGPKRPRKPEANTVRLAELGLTSNQVKAWAHEQGLIRHTRGRVAASVIEAYAQAHQPQQRTA